jgi:hypothetical protein
MRREKTNNTIIFCSTHSRQCYYYTRAAATVSILLLLKILEGMLHNNRITQKKKEVHKIQSIAQTERLWAEIETDIAMDTVAESLNIRRQHYPRNYKSQG